MSNLTLSIDDEVLKRAGIEALERGTSVNALVREYLTELAEGDLLSRQGRAVERLLALSEDLSGASPKGGWTRGELYEERLARGTRPAR